MIGHKLVLGCVAAACACACAPGGPQAGSEDLAPFVHATAADGVTHPLRVDFGSKVELVGYDLSPEGAAKPGESVHLTLYWKRSGQLDPGWQLFTHLEDEGGRQIANFDKQGALRGAISGKPAGLAGLELGTVYTDEQSLTLPKADALTPSVMVVVGVWNDTMRLPIVSGPTDGHDAAIISHFATGVTRRSVALLGGPAAAKQ